MARNGAIVLADNLEASWIQEYFYLIRVFLIFHRSKTPICVARILGQSLDFTNGKKVNFRRLNSILRFVQEKLMSKNCVLQVGGLRTDRGA